MKEKVLMRLDRLEEVIRLGVTVPHVAGKNADGSFDWNGAHYADEESIHHAVGLIPAEVWENKPLVVISIQGPKGESVKNGASPL